MSVQKWSSLEHSLSQDARAAAQKVLTGADCGSRESGLGDVVTGHEKKVKPKFEVRQELNEKVLLLKGSHKVYADLRVGALVNRTNGTLSDWTGLSNTILLRAGPGLKEECGYVPSRCQTGECKVTRGCNLSAEYVIHTVGPVYKDEFTSAAETALHYCYRNAISLASEQGVRSIAFPCIYTEKKGYPREDGAHIAIRTIRRFLEHFPEKIDHVVFYLENDADFELYKCLLLLYFPRDELELAWSKMTLPDDVGNEWGETVFPDRQIRKSLFNQAFTATSIPSPNTAPPSSDAQINITSQTPNQEGIYEAVYYGTDMMVDNANYLKYLERAKFDDLKDMLALNVVYQSGEDILGRPIIIWVVANMNVPGLNLERLFLYTIFLCDSLVSNSKGYVLVVIDDSLSTDSIPSISWFKSLYEDVIGRKYKKNIKAMYIVHPTIATKMLFWAAMPFVSSKFWPKHHYIESLDELYTFIPSDKLVLPRKVYESDRKAALARENSWF